MSGQTDRVRMTDTRVLVVEDEPPIRDMIAFGLRRAGCEVDVAENSRAALGSVADRRPDLVLVDWMLPDMSGLELVRQLRRDAATRDIPIVMLTARSEEADTDLERIGDEVEKVGNIAARLAVMEKPSDNYREIRHLGRLVTGMVHDALDAFARLDPDQAFEVARRDRKIDEEYEAIQRQNITFMMEDPRQIRRALEIMWVVRALERIGDHAKNICEYTVYMVHGKDIRHLAIDDAESAIRLAAHARKDS
jgi:CheY-like chemotaxis protein